MKVSEMSVRKRRAYVRLRMIRFLTRVRKPMTYAEVSSKLHIGSPMAVGQIMRGIVNDNPKLKKLTDKIVSKIS